MADVRTLNWDNVTPHNNVATGSDFVNTFIPSNGVVTSAVNSQNIINDGRAIWKLKVVVSAVTGTNPTLLPQLATSPGVDGVNFNVAHEPYTAMTASGTYWFNFS
jgi:hypothetical protein